MFIKFNYYLITYISFFIASFTFSILINFLFLKFVKTLGIRNKETTIIRWSTESKPSMGGISFFIIFLLSLIAYSFFFERNSYFLNSKFIGIIFACIIAFLMGLYDDAFNTKVYIKLLSQITASIILIITDTHIDLFASPLLNYAITVIWVVGIMNSINMLDNMDGITTIVSIFIISTFILIILIKKDFTNQDLILLFGSLAALIGFLGFNFHPSKMFMGDTGSQFLGAFLAAFGIVYIWNTKEAEGSYIFSKQIILVLTVFALPVIDTTTVTLKRLFKGKSPFVGGKDHTTHHLFYIVQSERKVAIIFAILSALSTFFGVAIICYLKTWNYIHVIFFSLYFLIIFSVLFCISIFVKPK